MQADQAMPGNGGRDDYQVLGQPPVPELQALTDLVCKICAVPFATITVFVGGAEHRVASTGVEPSAEMGVRFRAGARLLDPEGTAIGALCVADGTPRSLTEQQQHALRTLGDRAVDVLRLRRLTGSGEQPPAPAEGAGPELLPPDERIGRLSHDLRNPLTSVLMSLQMLREQPSVTEDQEALWLVDRALAGAHRMNALIERLVSGGREDEGPGEPTPTP